MSDPRFKLKVGVRVPPERPPRVEARIPKFRSWLGLSLGLSLELRSPSVHTSIRCVDNVDEIRPFFMVA